MTNADARQSVDSENRLSALTIYQAATSHWTHAEQIRWTLLYNYLMASTILLLAWSTLFANHRANPGATLLLAVISSAGAIISVVWILLGIRATGFVAAYHKLGLSLEGPESDT